MDTIIVEVKLLTRKQQLASNISNIILESNISMHNSCFYLSLQPAAMEEGGSSSVGMGGGKEVRKTGNIGVG